MRTNWLDFLAAAAWLLIGMLCLSLYFGGAGFAFAVAGIALVGIAAACAILTGGFRDYRGGGSVWKYALRRLPRWSFMTVIVIVSSIATCSLPS